MKDIRRATRKHYSAEDKIRIVLEGLRGEDSIAELCRREGARLPVRREGLPPAMARAGPRSSSDAWPWGLPEGRPTKATTSER